MHHSSASPRLNVAIVAPSMRILGGQAVQAERLLAARGRGIPTFARGWCRSTPSAGPAAARAGREIRSNHRHATDLLAAAAARATPCRRRPRLLGVVLLVPSVAAAGGPGRKALRQAGGHELSQRRGARPSPAVRDRAAGAAMGRAERRAVALSPRRVRAVRHRLGGHPEHRGCGPLRVPATRAARAEDPVHAKLRRALQRRLHAARVSARSAGASRCDPDAGRQRIAGARVASAGRRTWVCAT